MKQFIHILAITAAASIPAFSNVVMRLDEKSTDLKQEAVEVVITGTTAKVTGHFEFLVTSHYFDKSKYELFIPVYAAEGTDPEAIKLVLTFEGKPLAVSHTTGQSFGEIQSIPGQKPCWFTATVSADGVKPDTGKPLKVGMSYSQELSNGAFIYTPLIPKEEKGKDYGSITLSAEGPLTLSDPEKHTFTKDGEKLVVDPHHTRSIIVKAAAPAESGKRP